MILLERDGNRKYFEVLRGYFSDFQSTIIDAIIWFWHNSELI